VSQIFVSVRKVKKQADETMNTGMLPIHEKAFGHCYKLKKKSPPVGTAVIYKFEMRTRILIFPFPVTLNDIRT
jgi:hypothetical protein